MNIPADRLDLAAVRQANEKLWASHPELNQRQLTIDKSDTACRQEWMQLYQQALSSPKLLVPAPEAIPEPAPLPKPASPSPTAECPVGDMTHEEKMEQAIRMADLPAGVREAIGDPKTLVATFAICMGIMIGAGAAAAATGVGAIAEVVGAILLVGGAALAGYQIGTGMTQLYDFYEKTRCDRAKSLADLKDAGHDFASGVSNMGVGAFMLFLSMTGAKGKSWTGKNLLKLRAEELGAKRSQEWGGSWQEGSLSKTIEKVVGKNPMITEEGGKTIYTNPDTGIQVVYDRGGDYFRVYDPSLPGKRTYLDQDGRQVPNNKIEKKPDGTSRQVGKTKDEYQRETHFKNTD